jgi:hypothetical protein
MAKDKLQSINQSEAARRTMLAEWRAGRLHELSLPSGLIVKVTDVTMTDLVFTGKLPPALMVMAEKSAEGGAQEMDLKAISENAEEFGQLIDALVKLCMKEPAIAEKSDEDHITLDEMPGDDKMFIFNWINRETAAVQPFRDEGKSVSPGQRGKTVLNETKPDPALADRLERVAGG